MADNSNNSAKTPTHIAYTAKREGRRLKLLRWLEVGVARLEKDGVMVLHLDRLPVGGFTGVVYLAPVGAPPPSSDPQPQRPGETGDDEDESEDMKHGGG
jgi:hypothetical protein